MGFEKNLELAMEVIFFSMSENLLNPSNYERKPSPKLNDFDTALKLAFEHYYFNKEYTWTNLRDKESSRLLGKIYQDKYFEEIKSKVQIFLKKIDTSITLKLNPPYDELMDDIISDLSDCFISRFIDGKSNPFFEKIFEAYQSGGWPCGWEGEWPEGNPIVFYPPEKEE